MTDEKKSADEVDFQGVKSPEPESAEKSAKKTARKRNVIIASCIVASVLIAVAVACTVTLLKKERVSGTLLDIQLEEGDVFTYQVNQTFQINGTNNQTEAISSTVGLKVVHKTSEFYLFLVKIVTVSKAKTTKQKAGRFTYAGYFHVRLQRIETSSNNSTKESGPFDVYGGRRTDPEYVRYIHGVLYQLLPSVKRDLYEDIDGQAVNKDTTENSHLFPGPVRMHRQANTTQPDRVSIKSHFNRSDFVNSSSDVDLDMNYDSSASLNKTNGMVSESDVTLYEQLNFGKPMKTKDGHDVTAMIAEVHSHVTRVDVENFFKQEEIDFVETHLFVKLEIPVSDERIKFHATPTPSTTVTDHDRVSTTSSNLRGRKRREAENSPKRRVRRTTVSSVFEKMRQSGAMRNFSKVDGNCMIFEEKVVGINIKAYAELYTKNMNRSFIIGAALMLNVGSKQLEVYKTKFNDDDLERLIDQSLSENYEKTLYKMCIPAFVVQLCVEFLFRISFGIRFSLFKDNTALVPLQFAAEVTPSTGVTLSAQAYVSLWFVRGGVYVDGNLIKAELPISISYTEAKPTQRWCLNSRVEFTSFEIEAALFYQWYRCYWSGWWFKCGWGDRNVLYSFGRWAAFHDQLQLLDMC